MGQDNDVKAYRSVPRWLTVMGSIRAERVSRMSLRKALEMNRRPLSSKEQAVVEFLVSDPGNAAFMSARELADLAMVHESTVVRLGQKLGFEKYAQLRTALRADSESVDRKPTREGERQARDFELRGLIRDEIRVLESTAEYVPQFVIDAAAKDALTAQNIYITGNAHAGPAVQLLNLRLGRLGLNSSNVVPETKSLVEQLARCTDQDMIVVFVLRIRPPWLNAILRHADRVGAKVLIITDIMGYQFSPAPTHIFTAPRGPDPNFKTLIVPFILCYSFQLAIYHADPDRGGKALATIDDLRADVNGES